MGDYYVGDLVYFKYKNNFIPGNVASEPDDSGDFTVSFKDEIGVEKIYAFNRNSLPAGWENRTYIQRRHVAPELTEPGETKRLTDISEKDAKATAVYVVGAIVIGGIILYNK